MNTMLKTVNPEAAEAIDNPPPPPDVGTWVVFKGRAGFSRMHRTEFAALVLGSEPSDGTLTLMVVMEPEDMLMESRVPFQSHNQEYFCWRYRRASKGELDAVAGDLAERITRIEDQLAGDDALVEDLEQLNGRVKTVESVLSSDEVEVLEARVAALEKAKKGK